MVKAIWKLAERGGFEPPVRFNPYNGLANRRFRPLSHLSCLGEPYFIDAKTLSVKVKCRRSRPLSGFKENSFFARFVIYFLNGMAALGSKLYRLASRRMISFCALLFVFPAAAAEQVSFRNDVMAVLSKAGCNMGTCHGNQNGKAGFKLSLRGEDPEADYRALTRDMFARRTNPNEPDQSLLLLKATAQLAHEGGQRFTKGSPEYAMLRAWIAAEARDDAEDAPKLRRLIVSPTEEILIEPANEAQFTVVGEFADGSRRDVTRLAC